ncbi:MAG: hypothetical protein II399_09460 [Lachnospiraceae bacterium]|nr:hypothetical protein [Lachnospiraceae bacterium]
MADKNLGNDFSNNKKVKLIAGEVYDNLPYLKKAHSYMTQGELEGKKYGKSYSVYIPDPGEVHDGLEASPDAINEVEVNVTLQNKNTSVELDAWNKLTDIESFTNEIAKPRGIKLARSVEKDAIDQTVTKAFQVVSGNASFKTLTDMSKALDEVGVAGTKVSFVKPSVAGTIAAGGLANFIPSEIQSKIYKDAYLGQYAGASVIEESLMPVVSFTGSPTASFSTTAITAMDGTATVTAGYKVAVTDNVPFFPFKFPGAKIVGVDGMETDQDLYVIADSNSAVPEIRLAVKGYNVNNANAVIDEALTAATGNLTTAIATGKYALGQCRTEDAVGFDKYSFADLPGSENVTETVNNVSIKMSTYGDGKYMTTLTRLDLPYAVTLPDPRKAVVGYIKL